MSGAENDRNRDRDAGRGDGTPGAVATGVLTRGTVTVDRDRCKGCELCIPACRPGVLAMSTEVNEVGYRYPVLAPGCTGCQACHAVCPDYVFEVFKFDEPIRLPAAGHDADPAGDQAGDGDRDAHDDQTPGGAP
jgi:2-oxoglutarate ferredoxin oxidoreductase subunit delta